MSERAAFGVVIRFYQNETETTERIKENSLSQTTLFNCVSTITEKLKSEEFPEAFVNEIWDDIKHIRGKKNDDIQNQPIRNMLNLDYEYNANRWYEATIIFAYVYMVLASQYESLLHPFTILLTTPFGLVGAVMFFLITRTPLNIMGAMARSSGASKLLRELLASPSSSRMMAHSTILMFKLR